MKKGKIKISQEDRNIFFHLIRSILDKVAERNSITGGTFDTTRVATALAGSFATQGPFSETDIQSMAMNWINIEDDAEIVEAQYMEALENLDKMDDGVDPYEEESEELMEAQVLQANQGPSLVEFYKAIDAARSYGQAVGLSPDAFMDLDRFAHTVRRKKLSLPTSTITTVIGGGIGGAGTGTTATSSLGGERTTDPAAFI
jgi:hypothetical protein